MQAAGIISALLGVAEDSGWDEVNSVPCSSLRMMVY